MKTNIAHINKGTEASMITLYADTYQMALSMAWMLIQSGYDVEVGPSNSITKGVPVRVYFEEG